MNATPRSSTEEPYLRAEAGGALTLGGDWTLTHYAVLRPLVDAHSAAGGQSAGPLDISALTALDTAGAALLLDLAGKQGIGALLASSSSLPEERKALLQMVADTAGEACSVGAPAKVGLFQQIGDKVVHVFRGMVEFFGFFGLSLESVVLVLFRPRRWRITSVTAHLEQVGLDAVPIVALLTFLVGAVVAFLGATVLADFGATIYTVNLIGFSFLREFGVLLAAILVAGRTASAFASQIGSMKSNEEVDALRALGLDPMELLVVPRIVAMLLALPMLTFIAMMSGIAGGMVICAISLDIQPAMFFSMIQSNISIRHFLVGMSKAPVLAFLIAVVGCMEGLKVEGSAQSVGEHTTSAVVKSIFIVILVDAFAALFFMEMGW